MTKKKLSHDGNQLGIQEIIGWNPPVFHQASECYVSISAFDPTIGRMHMKKIMLGHIKGKRQQKLYGMELVKRLTQKLLEGWNPWIESNRPEEYALFSDVCDKYSTYLDKLEKEGGLKYGTKRNYAYKLAFMLNWVKEKDIKITYAYQFNKSLVNKFLDYVLIEKNDSLRTKNNYVGWLRTFSKFLLSRGFISQDPTLGLSVETKCGPKNRSVIPDNVLVKIKSYLETKNKHFLLASYLLHYLFIRPGEMTFIKIRDLSEENKTITLSGIHTKNGHDAVVTIPNHVIKLMKELGVFSTPPSYYLFSTKFRPGKIKIPSLSFAKYWGRHVKKDLKLPDEYKFYSLKDTGITNMIKAKTDLLSVRDQARHSSVQITNIYTPISNNKANSSIIGYEGVF